MEENKKNFILIGNSAFAFTEDNTFISDVDLNCQGSSTNQKQNQSFNTITITALNGEPVNQYGLLPNLTLYLNENRRSDQNHNQWGNSTSMDGVENYPFFNSENPVDFPFLSTDPISSDHGFDDVPEFIDVNSLVGREYQHCFLPDFNRNPLPMMKHDDVGELKDGDSSDDDVVFVKEYKNGEDLEDKQVPQLRRNPKRQVQLQKAANGFLSQYSFEELDACEDVKKKFAVPNNNKRTTRTTGAVLSPPSPLTTLEIKEWPVDGMHEKPAFNPLTRKIVKHPNATKKKPGPKPGSSRQKPRRKTAKRKGTSGDNLEFAKVAHNSFHHVLSYVQDVKEFNKLTHNENGENLEQAKSLLLDSCVLYCLSNGVSDEALVKYLDSVGEKKDVSGFLKGFVDDVENGKVGVCNDE